MPHAGPEDEANPTKMRIQALLLATTLCVPHLCHAQQDQQPDTALARDDDARAHYQQGRAFYERGDFPQAAEQFQQAYDLSGRPRLLYNLFLAHRDAGQLSQAVEALSAYLSTATDIPNRALLEKRREVLRETLAREQAAREAAAAADPAEQPAIDLQPASEQFVERPLRKRWWLWTAVGAVVAGTVVGVVAATRGPDEQTPAAGNFGSVVTALRGVGQ